MENKRLHELRKMLKFEPNDAFLNYAIAMEFLSNGMRKKAREQFESLLKLDPEYLPLYYQFGKLLIELEETEYGKTVLENGAALAQRQNNQKTRMEILALLEEYFDDEWE